MTLYMASSTPTWSNGAGAWEKDLGRDSMSRLRIDLCFAIVAAFAIEFGYPAQSIATSVFVGSYLGLPDSVIEYDAAGSVISEFNVDVPTALTIGPDGNLYVGSQTRAQPDYAEILKVDLASGQMSVFATDGIEGIFGITFGPNGNLFASSTLAGSASKVFEYDGATGALVGSFVAGPVSLPAPSGLIFGPSGSLFVGEHGAIIEYDGSTGTVIGTFATEVTAPNGLLLAPNGNLIVADSFDGLLELDIGTGELIRNIDPSGRFVAADFLPNGDLLATELDSSEVRRYDWSTGAFLGVFATTPGYPQGIAVIPEPSTATLLALGLVGIAAVGRRTSSH
jgi:WD40 repeat protein